MNIRWNGLDLSTVNKFLHSRRLLTITQWCFVDNNGLHVRMASGGKQDSRRLEDSTMEVIRVYFVKHKSVWVPIYESQAVKVDSSAITFIFNFNLNDKKIIYIYISSYRLLRSYLFHICRAWQKCSGASYVWRSWGMLACVHIVPNSAVFYVLG